MCQILFLFFGAMLFSFSSPHALASPFDQSLGLDAIYGIDDRELVSEHSSKKIQKLALSVAMIIPNDGFKDPTLIEADPLQGDLQVCSEERFSNQLSRNSCTGFLVGKDLVATAGHCFLFEDDCANKKIVFGVSEKKAGTGGYRVEAHDIFSCKKIVAQKYEVNTDYALIQLDRPSYRRPLKLNLKNKIADRAEVFMIGHPLGMPLTMSRAVMVGDNSEIQKFKAPLDSFAGNSGSPIFNEKTLEVEGILVGGREDFVQDEAKGCYRYQQFKEDEAGEEITRLSELAPFLPKEKNGKSWFWWLSHKYKIF